MNTTETIEKTVFFNASKEVVWEYLTDKEKLGEWYHPAESDLKEGQAYALVGKNDAGESIKKIWGKVLQAEKPNKLVQTFIIAPFGDEETTLTWVLEEAAGGTRLSLSHTGIAEAVGPAAMQLLNALDQGWDKHFSDLRASINA